MEDLNTTNNTNLQVIQMNFKLFEKKGQGSIEYLLLLAAAVVVVAVVISFMIGTIGPVQDSGGKQTLEFTCITLDSNTPTCGCYANGLGLSYRSLQDSN